MSDDSLRKSCENIFFLFVADLLFSKYWCSESLDYFQSILQSIVKKSQIWSRPKEEENGLTKNQGLQTSEGCKPQSLLQTMN